MQIILKKRYDTYNEAADEFYSSIVGEDIVQVHEEVWSGEVGKFEKRLKIQLETLEKFNKTIKEPKLRVKQYIQIIKISKI